jgi:signal transduction histidine kinase/CHASE3 domain sensor protein
VSLRSSLTARMVALGAALAVVVGLAIGALVLTIGDMRDASRRVRHSEQVLAASNLAEKQLLDLETGARGYALTREERFLDPWRSARTTAPRTMEGLSALVADNPAQAALVQQISDGIGAYIDGYSIPLVNAVRAQRNPPSTAEGKRRVDALREQFARFDAAEQRLADARRSASDHAAARAVTLGVIVLVAGVALLLAFAAYLGRAVARPVRRVAAAADRLAAGDLRARVPVHGRDELARLATSFNAMGDALQESRDELESQHAELELQTRELEDQQEQLASANDELRAQRDELEHITGSLAEETERRRVYGAFAEALATDAALDARADASLRTLAETAGAQVGALYAGDEEGTFELLASLGLERDGLAPSIAPDAGLAGRALAERTIVEAGHEEATLRVHAFGQPATVRREIHVPLLYGPRTIGVASLGLLESGRVERRACDVLGRLAEQAAVALFNAFVTRRAQHLAEINRAVLDTVRDGILMTGPDGLVVANAPARRLVEEIVGVPLEEAAELGPTQVAARTTDPEGYLAASAAIAADPDEPTFDEVQVTESGRVFERYTAPVRAPGGERLGRTTVIREVTAEREAERLKNELMATVSHELRTPLASIVGFTELLLLRDPEADVRRAHLQTVHAEARRLAELIDDFLDLQRIAERGRLPLERRRVDLGALVGEQARVFAAQSTAHTLAVRLPESALVTDADPSRLKQVLANLFSNAIKYSPDGGEIAVEGWARDGVVGVAVIDPGLGIPTAQQKRVFERFYRAPAASERAIGGTGLGLALSREIVEAHDGRMGFESVEGKGSRFWFELPAAKSRPAEADAPRDGERVANGARTAR